VRKFLIVVAALLAVFVVVDQIARVVAEHKVASELKTRYGLASQPSVSVHGFPFLTQVAGRVVHRVDVNNADVPFVDGQNVNVDLHLHHLRLTQGLSNGRVREVDGTVLLPFDQLQALAKKASSGVKTVSYGGEPDLVKIDATVPTVIGEQQVTAFGLLTIRDGRLSFRTTKVEINGQSPPSEVVQTVTERLNVTVGLPAVPMSARLNSVQVQQSGVRLGLTANDVSVG